MPWLWAAHTTRHQNVTRFIVQPHRLSQLADCNNLDLRLHIRDGEATGITKAQLACIKRAVWKGPWSLISCMKCTFKGMQDLSVAVCKQTIIRHNEWARSTWGCCTLPTQKVTKGELSCCSASESAACVVTVSYWCLYKRSESARRRDLKGVFSKCHVCDLTTGAFEST